MSGIQLPDGSIAPVKRNLYYKQPEDFNPSRRLQDIKLAPGMYLLRRIDKAFIPGTAAEVESETGLVMVSDKASEIPSMAKVVKIADEGCKLAKPGQYVSIMTFGGNVHDHLKPLIFARFLGDNNYMVVNDNNITAVVICDQEKDWPTE